MSWLNNSLNSIKGQLTTLAQEVLAETAGPGDEEYVTKTLDAKSALEDLSEAQKECDQLNKICVEKDNEIAILRKQIFEFQNKISDSGGGNVTATSNSGRTSKSPTTEPNVTTLEDSWCWEPENVKSDNDHSSETSSANGAEMVNITLDEVPLEGEKSRAQKRRKQRQSPEHTVELQKRVQQLEEENKQLNIAIDELDAQHNLAIQNVLELKKNLQDKLNAVNIDYAALKKEHADKFINGELELGKLKKQFEALQQEAKAAETQKSELQQKQDNYAAELKQAMFELADLQALLDKKDKDNIELIERIKAANKTNENAEEKYYELQQQVEKLNRELDEAKVVKEKKNSESSGSSGKQSDDEFIVVRDGDGASSGPTTPPTKEELKDKIVQLENKLSELTLENGSISLKLHDSEMEKQLSANVLKEQLLELQQKFDEKDTALAALNEELVEQREKIEQLKEQAADGIIASEKLKILSEEKELIQTEIIKLKELLRKSAELEKRLLISEQEKETLQLEMHTHRSASERVQELEQKLQSVTLEHQQLKLNAEAETEVLNNSAELQDKLRGIAEENEIMRLELNAMTQRKFVEKKKVTDLDADEEDESTAAFDYDKLKDLLAKYYKQDSETADNVELSADEMTERTFKTLRERLWQIDALEKSLAQMSEELLDLQDNKLVWDHEKKTLEADISQYVLQCDELVKNNEILLNEMDNFKRSKLETIPENNEENLLQLETQLEECAKLNRTLEEEYSELNEKIDELEREKQELTEKLRATQTENEQLQAKERDYLLQIETIELEKCNLQFELNELRSNEERNGEANVSLQLAEDKCDGLESQLQRLSKDHADLVAAMQAQKASLMEAHKKRDELEKILREHELLASRNQQQIMEMQAHHATYEKALEELMLQLKLKDEALSTQQTDLANTTELRTQVVQLQKELETKRIAAENLKSQLNAQQDITATTHEMNESNTKLQSDYTELQQQLSTLQAELQYRVVSEEKLQAELKTLQVQSMQSAEKDVLTAEHQQLQELFTAQTAELKSLQAAALQLPDQDSLSHIARLEAELLSTADLQKSVDSLNYEKNEMIKALQQKHAENMQYYLEIQRLQSIIQQLQQQLVATANADKPCIKCPDFQSKLDEMRKEHEKLLDQINFLKEKSDILTTNLLTEQTNQRLIQKEKAEVLEQNAAVQKDLERLREHLLEIEDMHTQETVDMQRDLDETKAKMIAMQTEVSMSSTAYTSASIRANQHAETLQAQYALVVQQRDELVAKLSLAEDRESKNQAALCNLQCALEQFQNDKENDIKGATLRIRRDLQQELDKAEQLRNEIVILNQQLADANQGIRAASRLSDQLEACQLTIAALREEVDTMKSQNQVTEQKLQYSESSQTDKIDKNLIKSLLIGYVVSGNPNDKTQVLRMISSVLDFTQNESDKVGLNKQQSSWFGAILGNGGGSGAAGTHSKDNLVQAFVAFLEQESQPQSSASNMPNLLNMTQATSSAISTTAGSGGTASRRTSISSNSGGLSATAPMPMQLLNSNVIDEFAPSRNSSSILKDILSDT